MVYIVDRRTALICVIVILVAVNLVLVGLFIYPLSEDDPISIDEAFASTEDDVFLVNASLLVDGETQLAVEGMVDGDGAVYQSIEESGHLEEWYRAGEDEDAYVRRVVDGEVSDDVLDQVEADPDETVVSVEDVGDRVEIISMIESTEVSAPDARNPASVVLNQLTLAQYETVEVVDDDREIREPLGGWYATDTSYRLTSLSGSVEVDPETNIVYDASIEWTLTYPTDSYLHYLWHQRDAAVQTFSYAYEAGGEVDVVEPEWVDDIE